MKRGYTNSRLRCMSFLLSAQILVPFIVEANSPAKEDHATGISMYK